MGKIGTKPEWAKKMTNILFVILNLSMVILTCIFLANLPTLYKVLAVLTLLILTLSIPIVTKKSIHKLFLTASVVAAICLVAYIALDRTGAIFIFKDFTIIKNFVKSTGGWGILVFMVVCILQAVAIPIPSTVIILVGTAIYGAFWSFVMVSVGTIIGSVITFFIGRTFGKKLALWMFGQEKIDKYSQFIGKKHKGMFIVMLLFPFFPDDLICILAGISQMSFKFFIISVILFRPIMIAVTAFLGTGNIIPFSGWGIPVWIALFAAVVGGFFAINAVKNKIGKKKNKDIKKE